MFIIDTNVISEVQRLHRGDQNVLEWFSSQPIENLFLSVITLQELYRGAFLKERKDKKSGEALLFWIDTIIIPKFDRNILSIDAETARICAALHVPNSRPGSDALIGATALQHKFTVATRNTKDFQPMGVRTINPWEFRG
jgi:toxin FitB